jgi:signal transduction histidine kinase
VEDPEILERLRRHKLLATIPDSELHWIASHGHLESWPVGRTVSTKGVPILYLYFTLKGHASFFQDRGGTRTKIFDWGMDQLAGFMPFSRMSASPGEAIVDEDMESWLIHRNDFPEMIRECPTVTGICVHTMLDRARLFKAYDAQDEKMMSLGKLSAGIAHELNNPASAASRSAKQLGDRLAEADDAVLSLVALGLNEDQCRLLQRIRDGVMRSPAIMLSPLDRSDREDSFADWLSGHELDDDLAGEFVETSLTKEMLDQLASSFDDQQLEAALKWVASAHVARMLAVDVERAATRMHQLVSAVKRFTHMGRASAVEATDIGQGLRDSVALLASKARTKSAQVSVAIPQDLPQVVALVGELNQVWLNLVDNAIDAVQEGGQVDVGAIRKGENVTVRVLDNGPGIPEEIRGRIFDPFFTTKQVGKGTGLGLEIVHRIVERHGGFIDVKSQPGRTEFCVTLPISNPKLQQQPAAAS